MTVTEARSDLPALIDAVEAGNEITLTRHGREVAVILRPDALRSRRLGDLQRVADEAHDRVEAARLLPRPPRSMTLARAEQLIAELRSERDGA